MVLVFGGCGDDRVTPRADAAQDSIENDVPIVPVPGTPIVIDTERDLGLAPGFALSAMAAHPSARRVYLGRYASADPTRRDLLVVSLDGTPQVQRVLASPEPRPHGSRVSVQQIIVQPDRLYL